MYRSKKDFLTIAAQESALNNPFFLLCNRQYILSKRDGVYGCARKSRFHRNFVVPTISMDRGSRKTGVHRNERKTVRCAWKRLSLGISFSLGFSIVPTARCTVISLRASQAGLRESDEGRATGLARSWEYHLSLVALIATTRDNAPTIKGSFMNTELRASCQRVLRSLLYFYYSIISRRGRRALSKGLYFNQANYMVSLL